MPLDISHLHCYHLHSQLNIPVLHRPLGKRRAWRRWWWRHYLCSEAVPLVSSHSRLGEGWECCHHRDNSFWRTHSFVSMVDRNDKPWTVSPEWTSKSYSANINALTQSHDVVIFNNVRKLYPWWNKTRYFDIRNTCTLPSDCPGWW